MKSLLKGFFIFVILWIVGWGISLAESGPGDFFTNGHLQEEMLPTEISLPSKHSDKKTSPPPKTNIPKQPPVKTPEKTQIPDETTHLKIIFEGKNFFQTSQGIVRKNGNIYVWVKDPEFARWMREMSLTYSWTDFSHRLFFYLPKGSAKWKSDSRYASIGEEKIEVPLTADKDLGPSYIPLSTLAKILDFKIEEKGNSIYITPAVKIFSRRSKGEEDTIEILLASSSPLKWNVKYQMNPPTLRFTIPKKAYNGELKKFYIEGVQVRVNDTIDKNKLFVTLQFPPHWKGKIIKSGYKNIVSIHLKPNIVYAWDTQNVILKKVKVIKKKSGVYIGFKTSKDIKYYWIYNPINKILYIDMPFTLPISNLPIKDAEGKYVKKCQIFTYKPDGVNITRICLHLDKASLFTLGSKEMKGYFTLQISDDILSPAPYVGSFSTSAFKGSNKILIVIDPGHGGSDPGALYKGYKEKHITLDISRRLAKILTQKGFKVILTRYTDTDVTYPGSPDEEELQARADIANKNKADLFISIHCNASLNKELRGSSYHWFKVIDKPLAMALKGSLGANIGTVDKGLRKNQFYVLSHTKVPAVLVETAFITNPKDLKILTNSIYRQKIASLLSKSIVKYIKSRQYAKDQASSGE